MNCNMKFGRKNNNNRTWLSTVSKQPDTHFYTDILPVIEDVRLSKQ